MLDRQAYKSPDCALNRHYAGVQSVSIERIQSSEGRVEDFVRDGHQRISVAKALGEQYIDAEVIEETC